MKVCVALCVYIIIFTFYRTADANNEPIWISPTNVSYDYAPNLNIFSNLLEDYSAEKGVWSMIPNGAGSRADCPIVAMDSKGILWIMFGRVLHTTSTGDYIRLYNVWNYDPKTDQYRYVWGDSSTARSDPRNSGQLRLPSPTNHPGAIYWSSSTIDNNDNIWFTAADYLGELWMFNTTSMVFTRMHGFDRGTDVPSIGINPGQPGSDVWPGYTLGSCMVADSNNDIWLLAGYNIYGYVNAVWRFNTTTYKWTYIYGDIDEQFITHNATYFGGTWLAGCFMDENDRVWMYGGLGMTDVDTGEYGSIWTFDTRVKRVYELEYGPDTLFAVPQSVSNDYHPDNHPGATKGSIFIDRMDGTLMLFSSSGYPSTGKWSALNQVWQYNKSLKQWRLVSGNTTATDQEGVYSNYRQPGSTFPVASSYPGRVNGKNFNGDMYIVGGSMYTGNGVDVPGRKDIWLIPNDQCSIPSLNKCDANADCIEEMIGYSCECKQGYTGDGFTCDAAPMATPVADGTPGNSPINEGTPVANTPSASVTPIANTKTSSASLVGASLVLFLVVLVM